MAVGKKASTPLSSKQSVSALNPGKHGIEPQPTGKAKGKRPLEGGAGGEPDSKKAKPLTDSKGRVLGLLTPPPTPKPKRNYCVEYRREIAHLRTASATASTRGSIVVRFSRYTDILHVARPLASVTEAVGRQPRAPQFALVSTALIDPNLRTVLGLPQPIARPRCDAIFPVYNGTNKHITLGVMQSEDTAYQAYYYDSAPFIRDEFAPTHSGASSDPFHATVAAAVASGWTPTGRAARQPACLASGVCDQDNGWACGLYAILNGWCYALKLELNAGARVNDEFYRDAITLINAAVVGLLKARLLIDFLRCWKYVTTAASPGFRTFERTQEVKSDDALNDLVEDAQAADALAASSGET